MDQVWSQNLSKGILIGFSKSGLGALNIAIEYPEDFTSVILFDAPLAHQKLPRWNTDRFYDQTEWERDLPINRIDEIARLASHTNLVHVSGANFHEDHEVFDRLLEAHGVRRSYIPMPEQPHQWSSVWIGAALEFAV